MSRRLPLWRLSSHKGEVNVNGDAMALAKSERERRCYVRKK